jgi:hypothetical protein
LLVFLFLFLLFFVSDRITRGLDHLGKE